MIPVCEPSLSFKEYYYVYKALKSNWLTCGGQFVNKLESNIAKYHNAKYGVALSSGTAALHMALLTLDIHKNDEVIVPSLSFVAVASMVDLVGATPIVVDVNENDWLISVDAIEQAISEKTKAIIPVHLYGNQCNMQALISLANRYNLYIIEDSCEAIGTPITADISCLSFQSTKTLVTGEGGMCILNNKAIADKIRFYKDHAMATERKYYHPEVGFNYRLTEMQAAIGCAQFERLDSFIAKKKQIHMWYREFLSGIDNITFQKSNSSNLHWVTPILVHNRDELMVKLRQADIETRVMFYPIHKMPPYKEFAKECPVANRISPKGMYLPSGVNLKRSQVKYICDNIKKYAR